MLQLLDEVERLEKAIRGHEREIQQKAVELRSEKDRLEQQRVQIDQEHRENRDTRRRLCDEMPPETLAAYEKIRTQRSRQAVVIVQGEVCPGCHMRIPPQTINEVLLTGEIRHCPYCRRILYCELAEQSA